MTRDVGDQEPRTLSRRRLLSAALAGAGTLAAQPALQAAAHPASVPSTAISAKAQDADRVKILHWSHPLTDDDMTFFEPLIEQFQEAGNNVDVDVQLVPWDGRVERKLSAYAAGTSPDTSYLNVDEFSLYADQGALAPLDGYVTQEEIDDLLPGPRDAMIWKDQLYEYPVLFAPAHMFYNRDAFEKSGLDPDKSPTTWTELDETLKAIKAAKDEGKHEAWPLAIPELESASITFNTWFYQAGGALLNADGTSGYDAPAGIEAATWAVYLADTFNSPANQGARFGDMEGQFFGGQMAYNYVAETRIVKRWQDDFPDFQLDVAVVPMNKIQWCLGGVGCYGIWSPSEHKDEAWKWDQFLTGPGNLFFNQSAGFVPGRTSLLAEYVKTAHPMVQKALTLAYPYAGPEKHPQLRDMWAAIDPEMQAAFAHDKTPEEAVRAAAAKVNQDVLQVG